MSVLGFHVADLIVIVLYFSVVIYIGYRAMKKVKNAEDFFLGGRQFGRFFQTFSQFGQATSAENAMEHVSKVGANGIAGAFASLVQAIPLGPISWLFPKWLRRLRLMTMADYFVDRFRSRKLAALYAIAQACLFILGGAMGLYAMSKTVCTIAEKPTEKLTAEEQVEYQQALRLATLEETKAERLTEGEKDELDKLRKQSPRKHFSYLNQKVLIVCMAFFVLLYAAGGGLEAAVFTDALQSVFILILTVLLIPFAMVKLNAVHGTEGFMGPFQSIHRILPESLFEIFGSPKWVEFKWYNIVILAVMGIAGNIAFANNLVVSGAARTEKIASFGGMSGTMIRSISNLFWMLLAMFILGIFGEHISDPDMMWGLAARTLLPTGLLGLMMACLLAAMMSTADTHMMTVSGLVTHNIYKPLVSNKPETHYVNAGRVLGLVYIVGSVWLAFHASSIYRMVKFMVFIIVACGPSMLMGFLWRRTNAGAVWASMGISLLITLFIPMFASFSIVRENPNLQVEIRSPAVVKTYTASERDVQVREKEIAEWESLTEQEEAAKIEQGETAPKPLAVGGKFDKTYQPAPRALFWDENIKEEDGVRYGAGLFKPEMYILHVCGVDFTKRTPSQVEAISLLIRLIFPFAAVFVVGLLTKPMDSGHLDRFYAKMRTAVNEDHDQDIRDVEESMAHPERNADVRLFPGTNWEFTRLPRYDLIGMTFAAALAAFLTGVLVLLARIGA